MSDLSHATRIDRVETEVSSIRTDISGLTVEMTGLKSDVRGLGSILGRIEESVNQSQTRYDSDKQSNRLNPVAMASVFITIISILVGGAWLIGGQLARQDERSMMLVHEAERVSARQWELRGARVPAAP